MNIISYVQDLLNRNKPKDKYATSADYTDVIGKIDEIEKSLEPEKPSLGENKTYGWCTTRRATSRLPKRQSRGLRITEKKAWSRWKTR